MTLHALDTANRLRRGTFVFKRCSCGHDLTLAEWNSLPSLGIMAGTELKNCPAPGCFSTMGVEIPERLERRDGR